MSEDIKKQIEQLKIGGYDLMRELHIRQRECDQIVQAINQNEKMLENAIKKQELVKQEAEAKKEKPTKESKEVKEDI